MTPISNYSVKAIKTFRARNGHGYSCNLLKDGKKVAEILEEGRGGELRVDWMDYTAKTTVISNGYDSKEVSYQGTFEESLFHAQVMKLPKIPSNGDFPEMTTSVHIVIDDMVCDTLAMKKLMTNMKKSLAVKCKDGKILTWKFTPTHPEQILRTLVLTKYPDGKIMNDLPIEESFQLYKEAGLVD